MTKSPVGEQGKAAQLSELDICVFIDERPGIRNEIKKTGCKVIEANGSTDSWCRDLRDYLRNNSRNDFEAVRQRAARTLRREQYSAEPPGRRRGDY